MHRKIRIYLNLLIPIFALCNVYAQESIVATGGVQSVGVVGSVAYSIGQVAYVTTFGINGSAAQGVQQIFEIVEVTGLNETFIKLTISVFPNPTDGSILLKIDNFNTSLTYDLVDIHGKVLITKKLEGSESFIEMGNLLSSVYFINVSDEMKTVKSFKIIKH